MVALVASVMDAKSSVPLLITSTLRWIVSPGAIAVALTVSRFVTAPVEPSAITTVPEATVWLADVELVKVANVPSPAMLAAAPRTATEARSLRVGDQPSWGARAEVVVRSPPCSSFLRS